MDHQELAAWLRLLHTPGIGAVSARKLLAGFGLPGLVFTQSETALAQVVSATQARALLKEPPELAPLLAQTWDWLCADPDARRILTPGDPLYPQLLLQTEDPPLLLYAMGWPQTWSHNLLNAGGQACLAMVGSRNPSPQGVANAHQFAQVLAGAGLTIVSGLALGIDGAAHRGALDGAAPQALATVAVVGTGLDRVYPGQHRELAHRIAERGVLLSEFALGTAPLPTNFPRRNRIISGMSYGTLVVEAALNSGSLITAQLASEQGREVFAIPGSIHASQARGCHALLKQGAKLVENAQDVLEEMEWTSRIASPHARRPGASDAAVAPLVQVAPVPEPALLQALGFDPSSLDALQARTGMPTPELLAALMALELEGQVVRLHGGLFQRVALA